MEPFIFHVERAGEISDGYHTFDELYDHRTVIFAALCKAHKSNAWKSWKHEDGTMYDNHFIAGIHTEEGQFNYHCHEKYWELFSVVKELPFAPPYDGHTPNDIMRLLSL